MMAPATLTMDENADGPQNVAQDVYASHSWVPLIALQSWWQQPKSEQLAM
jgi:hypothetical protein